MKTLQRIVLTWAIVMLTTIITMPNAYADNQAAVVIVATGEFYALDKNQTKRQLERRSKIYVGDTLVTGEKGRAQVRFIDGAVVALRPESELNIEKYSYGKVKADEGSLMTLLKGGFRTITGAIGKEKYKVVTSMATIGIRGTHYEAMISNNQLYVALWDGGVTVKNNAGQIDLGLGADYNFGMVQGENIQPQGQIDPPEVIVNDPQTQIAPDLSAKSAGDKNAPTTVADYSNTTLVSESAWKDTSSSGSSGITMPTSGVASYTKIASVSGTGNTSGITNFAYNATVDFAAATINGSMSFESTGTAGAHTWNLNFNGGPGTGNGVNGQNFSMNVDSSNSYVDGFNAATGTISGSFAGSNAEQMVGNFNVASQVDPNITAEGTFTATQ